MLNSVQLIGRLIHVPYLQMTSNGNPYVLATISVHRYNDTYDDVPIKMWGTRATNFSNTVTKDDLIVVEGSIEVYKYQNIYGEDESKISVLVNTFKLLESHVTRMSRYTGDGGLGVSSSDDVTSDNTHDHPTYYETSNTTPITESTFWDDEPEIEPKNIDTNTNDTPSNESNMIEENVGEENSQEKSINPQNDSDINTVSDEDADTNVSNVDYLDDPNNNLNLDNLTTESFENTSNIENVHEDNDTFNNDRPTINVDLSNLDVNFTTDTNNTIFYQQDELTPDTDLSLDDLSLDQDTEIDQTVETITPLDINNDYVTQINSLDTNQNIDINNDSYESIEYKPNYISNLFKKPNQSSSLNEPPF